MVIIRGNCPEGICPIGICRGNCPEVKVSGKNVREGKCPVGKLPFPLYTYMYTRIYTYADRHQLYNYSVPSRLPIQIRSRSNKTSIFIFVHLKLHLLGFGLQLKRTSIADWCFTSARP